MSETYRCNSNYVPKCLQRAPAPVSDGNTTDNEAADRARAEAAAAAAEAQRQRDAQLEQQRIEAENRRRAEEIAAQARFNQEKAEALGQLKGIANGGDFDSGLKGVGSTDPGLKDAPNSPVAVGLKPVPCANTDTDVVDACHVPTGLPKSVEAEIPNTPAGDRVRKGFQAIMDHDWNAAHAWFQDALNHDPGNAGIKRLIELSEYTMNRSKYPHPPVALRKPVADTRAQDKATMAALDARLDAQMDADLARDLDDFNRNYLPKHPDLLKPVRPFALAQKKQPAGDPGPELPPAVMKANWKAFFDALFKKPPRGAGQVGGTRD